MPQCWAPVGHRLLSELHKVYVAGLLRACAGDFAKALFVEGAAQDWLHKCLWNWHLYTQWCKKSFLYKSAVSVPAQKIREHLAWKAQCWAKWHCPLDWGKLREEGFVAMRSWGEGQGCGFLLKAVSEQLGHRSGKVTFFGNQVTDLRGDTLVACFGFREPLCILLKDTPESTGAKWSCTVLRLWLLLKVGESCLHSIFFVCTSYDRRCRIRGV